MKSQKVYYYVAYGSNTLLTQMSMRCPNSQLIATGFLKGYELLFRGHDGNCFATIEKISNHPRFHRRKREGCRKL